MSQSLPYISSESQLLDNTSTLDLRGYLDGKCKEVIRNRQLRDRYRQERDEARVTHGTTKDQLDETKKALAARDQELASTNAELMRTYKQVIMMEGEVNLANRNNEETVASNKRCTTLMEKAEKERDTVKKELIALQNANKGLKKTTQPAKLKEIALINRAERVEADLGITEAERNEILLNKARLTDDLKAAKGNVKVLTKDMTPIQISCDAKPSEVQTLKVKLKASETGRNILVQQVKQLMEAVDKLSREKGNAVSDGKKAKDGAAAHQQSVDTMLKCLDHQSKADMLQFGQLEEQVKTVVGGRVAHVMERDKEAARMGAEIQELLLENAELREEVRSYKEDGGVMALD